MCDADVCRRATGGGEGAEGGTSEEEDVDRYGLPTHWYQPPFSTVVHGFAGDETAGEQGSPGQELD